MRELVNRFASKKLLTVLLAYSVLILQGSGLIQLPSEVIVAASTAMTAQILGQSVIDARKD